LQIQASAQNTVTVFCIVAVLVVMGATAVPVMGASVQGPMNSPNCIGACWHRPQGAPDRNKISNY